MKTKALGVALAAVVASGCAATPARAPKATPPAGSYLTLVSSGATNQLKLDGAQLYGPRVNASLSGDGLRGVLDHKLVDLQFLDDDRIFGYVAGARTELYVSSDAATGALRVRGLYRGRVSEFEVSPQRVQGLLGQCNYRLVMTEGEPPMYWGGRACGVGGTASSLSLPPAFHDRPARERAAVLVLFLGG